MRSKLLHTSPGGERTLVAILDTGDEVMASLKDLAAREKLDGAQLSAIGAFRKAVISYFDWETKKYLENPVREQVEVASMLGDIATDEAGNPSLHVHLVLGRKDGSALAGHLVEGHVRPTLEVVVTETPRHLRRLKDRETDLHLIRLDG